MPWSNGAGITYEIVRSPESGDFDWRISLADIDEDGPFSVMNGIDRWLVLTEGDHIVLSNGDSTHLVEEHVPFAFPGEIAYDCTLGSGQARDLNVMTRRGVAMSNVRILDQGSHDIHADNGTHIIVALIGETEIGEDELEYRDAAIITGNQLVVTNGACAHIVIQDTED